MLLRSKFDGLHHAMYVPMDSHTEIGPGGRKQFSSSVASAKDITLKPGINAVSTKIWEEAKNANPMIAAQVSGGKIVELGEYDPNSTEAATIALVEECVQEEFLRGLEEHDERAPVRKAVKAQLAKIENYVKLRKGE